METVEALCGHSFSPPHLFPPVGAAPRGGSYRRREEMRVSLLGDVGRVCRPRPHVPPFYQMGIRWRRSYRPQFARGHGVFLVLEDVADEDLPRERAREEGQAHRCHGQGFGSSADFHVRAGQRDGQGEKAGRSFQHWLRSVFAKGWHGPWGSRLLALALPPASRSTVVY